MLPQKQLPGTDLFLPERQEYWRSQKDRGFRDLFVRKWTFTWSGEAARQPLPDANPVADAEALFAELAGNLRTELGMGLESFVTAEEYYEPVMEVCPLECCEDALRSEARRLGLS